MNYVSTLLEDSIEKLYLHIGVQDPDYSMEEIADKLGIVISYYKLPFSVSGNIFLDPQLPKEKQKEIFAHELCHELYHVGLQIDMPFDFYQLQEWQARNFALHFCVPTFMLRQINLANFRDEATIEIAETFGITNSFAAERLEHYEKQIVGALFHEKLLKCSESMTSYADQYASSIKFYNN